jgi:hypothetical protein
MGVNFLWRLGFASLLISLRLGDDVIASVHRDGLTGLDWNSCLRDALFLEFFNALGSTFRLPI